MNPAPNEKLRTRREALQLSLDDVSDVTRISVENLSALEEDRSHELPEGPYQRAFLRAYDEYLLQEEERSGVRPAPLFATEPQPNVNQSVRSESDDTAHMVQGQGTTLRWVAVVVGVLVLIVFSWRGVDPFGERLEGDAGVVAAGSQQAAPADLGKQELSMRALRNTEVAVIVDGSPQFEGVLVGGQKMAFEGRAKIEVMLQAVGDVSLHFNGEKIMPLGNQDEPRRLVFIDDR